PTKKPSSGIYPRPKPPYHPQPGMPDNSGGIYPRPKPPYHPQPGMPDNSGGYFGNRDQDDGRYPPRPRPPAAGGGGYYPNNDGHGNAYGGDGYSTYGNQQGNTIAKIVSPIVSVLVVMLVGAATGWFQRNRRRNCFRTRGKCLELESSFRTLSLSRAVSGPELRAGPLETTTTTKPPLLGPAPAGGVLPRAQESPGGQPHCAPGDERGTMPVLDQAFVTLATNDTYCQGALVLGQSLRTQRATRKLVVLITSQVSSLLRVILSKVFDEVIEVSLMDSANYSHLAFLKRPELGVTLTKLHCWTLTHYSKCVFLDADTLVLSNIDELFDRAEFSAAPDPGWPDCFNSGVFVFQPSLETHGLLLRHAVDHGSFDGADQGLLNSFFSSWSTADIHKHLPFIYNLSSNTAYTYSPAFKRHGVDGKSQRIRRSVFAAGSVWWNQVVLLFVRTRGLGSCHMSAYKFICVQVATVLPPGGQLQSWKQDEDLASVFIFLQTGVGEPCAESAGSSQPWPAEGPSEETVVTEDIPPSPKGCRSEDTIGWPELETSAGVRCDPLSPPSPQCADSTETQTTSRPADKAESGPSVEAVEPSQEPPVDVTGDPSPQDALEVDLAVSVFEISIEEKVKAPSPEEERRHWEEGRIDYMGKDAFARIQEKLDRFLQ
ncbi:glycogenin-2-like, partial [Lynx pardinus]